MIQRIAELLKEKKIEGISEIRDESDRQGVRVVIEIKRDFQADVVLNQLYKYTPLQTSFGMNMLAIYNGRPMLLNLKDIIKAFIEFREEVIRRRTIFELNKARDRAHTLVGLAIAVENIDPVIELIRTSPSPQEAKDALLAKAWPAGDVEALVKLIDEPDRKVENENLPKLFFKPVNLGLDTEAAISDEFGEILQLIRENKIKTRSIVYEYDPKDDNFVKNVPEKYQVCRITAEMIANYSDFENFLRDLYKHEHYLEKANFTYKFTA